MTILPGESAQESRGALSPFLIGWKVETEAAEDKTGLGSHRSAGAQDVLTLALALSRAFSAPGQGAHREKEAAPDLASHLPAPGYFQGCFNSLRMCSGTQRFLAFSSLRGRKAGRESSSVEHPHCEPVVPCSL